MIMIAIKILFWWGQEVNQNHNKKKCKSIQLLIIVQITQISFWSNWCIYIYKKKNVYINIHWLGIIILLQIVI